MFESISNWLSGLIEDSCSPSHGDSLWGTTSSESALSSISSDISEPSFHNAFGCGPDYIVPSQAYDQFPSFEFTEITYGSLFDDSSSNRSDWD